MEDQGNGIDALVMAQHGGGRGKTVMHGGKALVYLNPKCDGNHYLRDCPTMSNQDKVTIFAATREKCKAEVVARKAKQAKTVTGQAHM